MNGNAGGRLLQLPTQFTECGHQTVHRSVGTGQIARNAVHFLFGGVQALLQDGLTFRLQFNVAERGFS